MGVFEALITMAYLEELKKIQTEVSEKVSDSLQPLNKSTAPFFIQLLRGYVDVLEEQYPGASDVADVLEKCSKRNVVVTDLDG